MPEVGPAALPATSHHADGNGNNSDGSNAVLTVENSDFRWSSDNAHQPPQLRGISLAVRPGELVIVAGPVGAGKSTLIEAILGEVSCVRGGGVRVKAGSRLAYCAQQPWIQAGTVRDNILFARAKGFLDPDGYDRAVAVCALTHDFERLDQGDLTQIGELGINLSGRWVPTGCSFRIWLCPRTLNIIRICTRSFPSTPAQQGGSEPAWRWRGRCMRTRICTS